MATVADKITEFRQLADVPVETGVAFVTSNGTHTLVSLNQRPVIAVASVQYAGVAKTPNTDYVVNRDTGVVTFITMPASGAEVKVTYTYAVVSDDVLFRAINTARAAAFPWIRQEIDTETTSENIAVTGARRYSLAGLTVTPKRITRVELMSALTGGTTQQVFLPGEYELRDMDNAILFREGSEPTSQYLRIHYAAPLTPYATTADVWTDELVWESAWTSYLWKTLWEHLAAHWSVSKDYVNRRLPGTNPGLLKNNADAAARDFEEQCVAIGRTFDPYDRPSRTLTEPEFGETYRE